MVKESSGSYTSESYTHNSISLTSTDIVVKTDNIISETFYIESYFTEKSCSTLFVDKEKRLKTAVIVVDPCQGVTITMGVDPMEIVLEKSASTFNYLLNRVDDDATLGGDNV